MDKLLIKGGTPLQGNVEISGAKNAALPILAGTLLATEPVIVRNVPHLKDVTTTISLLQMMGVQITVDEQRMDLVTDKTAKAFVDKLVPSDRPLAGKFLGHNERLEVGAIVAKHPDGGVFKASFYEVLYLFRVHTGPRVIPGRAVYRETNALPNAATLLCMIAGPKGHTSQ